MTATTENPHGLTGPGKDVNRDRWGRPLIIPPNGGPPVPYTRATTIAGTLDDLNGLMAWKQRMTAIGITDRPDLQIAVAAHRDDKKRMDGIVQEAMDAAAASAAATTGTALHAFTEQIDSGDEPEHVPAQFVADLAAYIDATTHLRPLHIEQIAVVDNLQVAGTPDRIVEYQGELFVADVKTGSIDFPGKISLQLALYANALRYDVETGQRHPWDPARPVNKERAIIIHLPAGQGRCELKWVRIDEGTRGIELAMRVREWRRNQRALVTDFIPAPLAAVAAGTEVETAVALEVAINEATSVDELNALYFAHQVTWTAHHTALAAARKAQLVGVTA